jgi:hypothetical protein
MKNEISDYDAFSCKFTNKKIDGVGAFGATF